MAKLLLRVLLTATAPLLGAMYNSVLQKGSEVPQQWEQVPQHPYNDENEIGGDDGGPIGSGDFMLIASPSMGKVSYTELEEFRSKSGVASPLITTGLKTPMGVAFDKDRGFLYVADKGAKAIYRYLILVNTANGHNTLVSTGERLTMMQGHAVEWITCDTKGNLLYTAPDSNNINKITVPVMGQIADGLFKPEALVIVSEKTKQVEAAKRKAQEIAEHKPVDEPALKPDILRVYEATDNPLVSAPAALWASPPYLFWTNTKNGKKAGTVVKGFLDPTAKDLVKNGTGPPHFWAKSLTFASDGAYALAQQGTTMFFTQNSTDGTHGLVSALLLTTGDVIDIVTNLEAPRGLAWDGDETMFVADEVSGVIWSFPAGRYMVDPPMRQVVTMAGAYGLTILSKHDPCFQHTTHMKTNQAVAPPPTPARDDTRISLLQGATESEYDLGGMAGSPRRVAAVWLLLLSMVVVAA
jgi:sugar lactone lactonase YvrE